MIKIDYTSYLSKSKNFRQRFLILHYTALNFKDSVIALNSGVSAHYLVPTLREIDPSYPKDEIIVYALVPESDRAWHAGVSQWGGRVNLNDSSIGIETVNLATESKFQPFNDKQIDCLIQLCLNILERYPDITATNVLAHSDISPDRKSDPGPLFPWKKLYDNGIGAWYDQKTVNQYLREFSVKLPSKEQIIDKLGIYGYKTNIDLSRLLMKFQMHFRNTKYDGKLDAETAAIIYALVEKYK